MTGNIINMDNFMGDFEEYIRALDAKNTVKGNKYSIEREGGGTGVPKSEAR